VSWVRLGDKAWLLPKAIWVHLYAKLLPLKHWVYSKFYLSSCLSACRVFIQLLYIHFVAGTEPILHFQFFIWQWLVDTLLILYYFVHLVVGDLVC